LCRTLNLLQSARNCLELLLSLLRDVSIQSSCHSPRWLWKRKPCNPDIWPAIRVPSQPPILYRFVSSCCLLRALIQASYLANFMIARVLHPNFLAMSSPSRTESRRNLLIFRSLCFFLDSIEHSTSWRWAFGRSNSHFQFPR